MKYTRITVDPTQMGGVPCLRGLRIPVATVVAMVADGMAGSRGWRPIDLDPGDIAEGVANPELSDFLP